MRISMLMVLLVTGGLLAGNAPATGKNVYQWTDEDGVVHYSAQPPPQGTDATEKPLTTIPRIGTLAPQPRAGNPEYDELTPRQQATSDREELARQRINASSYDEALAVECNQAENVIGKLTAASGIQIQDSSGNARIMSDKERLERITLAEEFIQNNCQ